MISSRAARRSAAGEPNEPASISSIAADIRTLIPSTAYSTAGLVPVLFLSAPFRLVVSTSASYTFTATANRTLIANFKKVGTISTSADPTGGGTTSGGGVYLEGTSVILTAAANPGYTFLRWTGPQFISTDPTFSFFSGGGGPFASFISSS